MVFLINRHNAQRHRETLAAMHATRKKVFVDLLGWRVPHEGGEERDLFDDADAVYLVVEQGGEHRASARLLRTDRPHILGDLFPSLCEGPVPRGAQIREITRFCLAPGIGRTARLEARCKLIRALVEYALFTGVEAYTGVAELSWLSQILAAGWDVRPLGLPQQVDGRLLGALEIAISARTLGLLRPGWRCDPAPSRTIEFDLPLAA